MSSDEESHGVNNQSQARTHSRNHNSILTSDDSNQSSAAPEAQKSTENGPKNYDSGDANKENETDNAS